MTIIADAPEGYQAWPDIRTIAGTRLINPDMIAYSIAAAAGQQLVVRVEQPGRGPLVYVHPRLVEAVQSWYERLPRLLAEIAGTIPYPVDERQVDHREADAEDTKRGAEETRRCSLFAWCDGHDGVFPETDGVHMTQIQVGAYDGGEPKIVHAIRYLPVEDGDEAAHWSFSMPEGGEWSFRPEELDEQIESGIAELQRARRAIDAFLAVNDGASNS